MAAWCVMASHRASRKRKPTGGQPAPPVINAQTLQASAPPDGRATGSAARSQYQRELTELLRTWKPPAVDRNNFLEAENALVMDGRAARRSYAEIATVLPGHDEGSVRAQHSYLLSLVRCVLHYGGVCTLVTQQAKQQRMPPSMPPVHRRPTPPPCWPTLPSSPSQSPKTQPYSDRSTRIVWRCRCLAPRLQAPLLLQPTTCRALMVRCRGCS